MRKIVKYNELFGGQRKFGEVLQSFGSKKKEKDELLVEDPSFVEDIKQICMPLLDDGLLFEYTFNPTNGSKCNYQFNIHPSEDYTKSIDRMDAIKGDNIGDEEIDKRDKWIDESLSYIEAKHKYAKSILENIAEIDDRLDEYIKDWTIKMTINPQNCFLSIGFWKGPNTYYSNPPKKGLQIYPFG